MSANYHIARFRIEDGPPELFLRVEYVMCTKGELRFPQETVATFLKKDDATLHEFESINLLRWDLVEAGVRMDSGKFVSSTWERNVGSQRWRIIIGMHNKLLSIERVSHDQLPRLRRNDSADVRFVADVNRVLMEEERAAPKTLISPCQNKVTRKALSEKSNRPPLRWPNPKDVNMMRSPSAMGANKPKRLESEVITKAERLHAANLRRQFSFTAGVAIAVAVGFITLQEAKDRIFSDESSLLRDMNLFLCGKESWRGKTILKQAKLRPLRKKEPARVAPYSDIQVFEGGAPGLGKRR